jgi:hypothetical protein
MAKRVATTKMLVFSIQVTTLKDYEGEIFL